MNSKQLPTSVLDAIIIIVILFELVAEQIADSKIHRVLYHVPITVFYRNVHVPIAVTLKINKNFAIIYSPETGFEMINICSWPKNEH